MGSKIYLFPGQGSQKKGMGADVFPLFPAETAAADGILGYPVAQQCIEDPGGKLSQTQFTQPLLFTACSLLYLKKMQDSGRRPEMVAGHSVGEFAAPLRALTADMGAGARTRVLAVDDFDTLWPQLEPHLAPDAVILLKASRGMRLERLVPFLTAWATA